jgi:hypothetical protein
MTPEIRTELLKLSRPNVDFPDVKVWIERARELEAYVSGAGEPSKDVQPKAATQVSQVRTPRKAS